MSSADRKQLGHDLPGALMQRLQAIRFHTTDWHEWHQAGVLMQRLAESAHSQYSRKELPPEQRGVWHDAFLGCNKNALALFEGALRYLSISLVYAPKDIPLTRLAIRCDKELALAFQRYVQARVGSSVSEQSSGLEEVIGELEGLPDTPARNHQLTIAYGFMVRELWWRHLARDSFNAPERAKSYEAVADRLFRENLHKSPDGGRAYCSFLLAQALFYATPSRRYHYAWPALRLAWKLHDYKQAFRCIVIALWGADGEAWLLSRRDTLTVFTDANEEMRRIFP